MWYLKEDLYKRGQVLLQGSEVTSLVKISNDPMLFSATIQGEKWCVGLSDLTETKPLTKTGIVLKKKK
jgi:hypothetical protein